MHGVQPLDGVAVVALDTHGGVDRKASCSLPGEHFGGLGCLEEVVAPEVAEHAALDGALEVFPVTRLQLARLMELDVAVLGLGEHAVEDEHVVVKVGVQGEAEAVEERARPDPDVLHRSGSPRTRDA